MPRVDVRWSDGAWQVTDEGTTTTHPGRRTYDALEDLVLDHARAGVVARGWWDGQVALYLDRRHRGVR